MAASRISAGCVLLAAVGCAVGFATTLNPGLLVAAVGLLLLLVPTSAIFKVHGGWPRAVMIGYAAGLLALLAAVVAGFWGIDPRGNIPQWLWSALTLFLWADFLQGWFANALIGTRVRK